MKRLAGLIVALAVFGGCAAQSDEDACATARAKHRKLPAHCERLR